MGSGSPVAARILVAGIGNIFLGDDGFGSEVVRHAAIAEDDEFVRVVDYGIGGMHLARVLWVSAPEPMTLR